MEDGEIKEECLCLEPAYDPAFEWPGIEEKSYSGDVTTSAGPSSPGTPHSMLMEGSVPDTAQIQSYTRSSWSLSTATSPSSESGTLRLTVQQTSILPRNQTVAVIDGFFEVQFGRDIAPPGSDIPRIRLREMEVSKLHSTVYWDQSRSEWAVVDMGSKHGTFVQSSPGSSTSAAIGTIRADSSEGPDPRGTRLSPPRVASVPRRLKHGDALSIGSTTFVLHIHDDRIPCVECSPKGGDEIPLFDNRRTDREREAANKRKRSQMEAFATPQTSMERNPRKAMTMLKRSLLSRHDASQPALARPTSSSYIDRSARRRALHPDTPPDTPTLLAPVQSPKSRHLSSTPAIPRPVSAPPTPLPSTNIGHRLLIKQGWQPGTGLGSGETDLMDGTVALVEPLEVIGNSNRAGLGMPLPSASAMSSDWQDDAKRRRWASMKLTDQYG